MFRIRAIFQGFRRWIDRCAPLGLLPELDVDHYATIIFLHPGSGGKSWTHGARFRGRSISLWAHGGSVMGP